MRSTDFDEGRAGRPREGDGRRRTCLAPGVYAIRQIRGERVAEESGIAVH